MHHACRVPPLCSADELSDQASEANTATIACCVMRYRDNCRAGDEVVITSRTILGARAVAASLQAEVGPTVRVQARISPSVSIVSGCRNVG